MTPEMRAGDLAAAAHANLIEVNALLTAATPGGVVERGDGELLYASPHPFRFLSGAMRSHQRDRGEDLVERANDFFRSRGKGFTIFVREGDDALARAAAGAGLPETVSMPAMVSTRPLAVPPTPAGVEVRRVEDLATARDYWELCEASYRSLDFPDGVFATFPPEMILIPAIAAWVAYLDGAPASAAMVVSAAGAGMVAWVATIEAVRGRGLGALCTVLATNEAFERGGRFASLQASRLGEPIYRRLGYEHLFTYKGFGSG